MTDPVRLVLSGTAPAAEQRHVDALTCLRDVVPGTLQVVAELRYRSLRDTRGPRASGDWAYCVSQPGLRFEAKRDWWSGARERGEAWGWNRTPAHLLTWDELAELVGHDPRRAAITAWAETLPAPRGRRLQRPFELWPDPAAWKRSYLCGDHQDPHWPGRRQAWQLVLDLLTDAIDAARRPGSGERR